MKKKKNLFHILYVVILMAFFTGVGLTITLKPQSDYSRNENRYLEKLPALTWDSYKTGDFGEQFDKAVTDQFPFRDFFTGMSTTYRKLMGFHDVGDVYLGKEHYYFDKKLEKDMSFQTYLTNLEAVRFFANTFGAKEDEAAAETSGQTSEAAASEAAAETSGQTSGPAADRATFQSFKVMLIPSPASVLKDDLPPFAKIYEDAGYFDAAKSTFGEDFIDTREAMAAAFKAGGETNKSDETNISDGENSSYLYFRTDHHWTHRGAYEAYKVYEQAIGQTPGSYEDMHYEKVSDSFYGTMFSRALDTGAVPDTIELPEVPDNLVVKAGDREISSYDWEKLEEKDHYAVYFGGNYPVVTITNPNVKTEKKLLVFKDSFANSFIPLLVNDYSEITLIDLRYETRPMSALMNTYRPEDVLVLFEMSNFATTKEILRMGML